MNLCVSAIFNLKNFAVLFLLNPFRSTALKITVASHYAEVFKNHVSRFCNQQ